jgi:hypothetical protein
MAIPLAVVLPFVGKIIDKVFPDESTKAEAKIKLLELMQSGELQQMAAAKDVVVAEIQGESAAQRNWRPHLMYLIMLLMVFNGVVVPLVEAMFGVKLPILEAWSAIPDQMWSLLQIGMGGYIVGRSGEKIAKTYFEARKGG